MLAVALINRSLNLAGIVSRGVESETGEEGADGLFWLNQLLFEKAATGMLAPYYAHVDFPAVPGQEKYFISGLITAEVLTFFIQNVRYSVRGVSRNSYLGDPRANNVSSLPYQWYWERVPGGMDIYLYFFPGDAYNIQLTGLKSFDSITFDTELDPIMDKFYQNFLMFELCESLCAFYRMSMPPQTEQKLKRLRKEMVNINPRDLSIKKISLLGSQDILSYAQANWGRGWTPS